MTLEGTAVPSGWGCGRLFLGTPRNATVVCDEPAVVYRLTVERWREIRAEDPEAAQTLEAAVISALGERVAHLTRVVDALQGG